MKDVRRTTATATAAAAATATATACASSAERAQSTVEVVPLCDGEWRLCDRRIPADDSRRLLSYVSRDDDGFEVLWLPTLTVQRVGSLEAAIEAARRACSGPRA